jgi:signal transducing adaptor molecule
MPEPTASQLAKEAEQEAAAFSLTMLRTLDPTKDTLVDMV